MTNPDTKTRLPIAAQTKYCVAIGNFRDGFSLYGPYDTLSEAKAAGRFLNFGETFMVTTIEKVEVDG